MNIVSFVVTWTLVQDLNDSGDLLSRIISTHIYLHNSP